MKDHQPDINTILQIVKGIENYPERFINDFFSRPGAIFKPKPTISEWYYNAICRMNEQGFPKGAGQLALDRIKDVENHISKYPLPD